jgi:hypothetical protein
METVKDESEEAREYAAVTFAKHAKVDGIVVHAARHELGRGS